MQLGTYTSGWLSSISFRQFLTAFLVSSSHGFQRKEMPCLANPAQLIPGRPPKAMTWTSTTNPAAFRRGNSRCNQDDTPPTSFSESYVTKTTFIGNIFASTHFYDKITVIELP